MNSVVCKGALATALMPLLMIPAVVSAGEFTIEVGGFYAKTDSSFNARSRVDELQEQIDLQLDFEKDLKLEEEELLPYFKLNYAFNDRHYVYFDYKRLHRSATSQGSIEPFEFDYDGDTYIVDGSAELTSSMNVDISRIGYGYKFFNGERLDLGISLGLHVMYFEVGFEGQIEVCDQGDNSLGCAQSDPDNSVFSDVTAPLPDIGLSADFDLTEHWTINTHAQYFHIKIDNIEGEMIDLHAGLKYQFVEDWHLNFGWRYYDVTVDDNRDNGGLDVGYQFQGPMLILGATF
ncbi:DUF481 domain-containing protein [Thalassotalea mangrovi]|uniref:DUF481 domain-containing protein n=1 Tax=Thalassotalea mangrovi TaxID=2572245 RepID=A0A4U1B7L6_9GAMM|nr:DUF481 domain-containing protein [Thalassotalea mangrovi]TKB46594.1 DUF481 domain-containing protein [Thalassotalea mangrovi]